MYLMWLNVIDCCHCKHTSDICVYTPTHIHFDPLLRPVLIFFMVRSAPSQKPLVLALVFRVTCSHSTLGYRDSIKDIFELLATSIATSTSTAMATAAGHKYLFGTSILYNIFGSTGSWAELSWVALRSEFIRFIKCCQQSTYVTLFGSFPSQPSGQPHPPSGPAYS